MLDVMGVPRHKSPSEAEADCANMNCLELVDAVWSHDGDAFMFGCRELVKFHYEGAKVTKTTKHIDNNKRTELEAQRPESTTPNRIPEEEKTATANEVGKGLKSTKQFMV